MTSAIGVRRALPEDMAFVSAAWFESYWKGTAREQGISHPAYKAGQDALIKSIVPRATIDVVYVAEIPSELLAFSVRQGSVVHYVYVKAPYRRMGIASGLTKDVTTSSHQTPLGKKFAKARNIRFNPYSIYWNL